MTSSSAKKNKPVYFAKTRWFPVFCSIIDQGDLGTIGPHAFAVYGVIKKHANHLTGVAFPSMERISRLAEISLAQVKRSIKALEEAGYLRKTKAGRSNRYVLCENILITDSLDKPRAMASWDYAAQNTGSRIASLNDMLAMGNLSGNEIIRIKILSSRAVHDDGAAHQQFEQDLAKLPFKMAETLRKNSRKKINPK